MTPQIILAVLCCLMLLGGRAQACTGVVLTGDGSVIVGKNEDWYYPYTRYRFQAAEGERHGYVVFGYWDDDEPAPEGGMNDQGLVFDGFFAPEHKVAGQEGKPLFQRLPLFQSDLFEEVLATCATVDEALALFDHYSLVGMTKWQVLLADAQGNAVIFEGDFAYRMQGTWLVATNFRRSNTSEDEIACWYYLTAKEMIQDTPWADECNMRNILAATHRDLSTGFPTLHSLVYNLSEKTIDVYYFHDLSKPVAELDLTETFPSTEWDDMLGLFPEHPGERLPGQ